MKVEEKTIKWLAELTNISISNNNFERNRQRVQSIVKEVIADFNEIIDSEKIDERTKVLLFPNVISRAKIYHVDASALLVLLFAKGFNLH